jgi:hypothetical protein
MSKNLSGEDNIGAARTVRICSCDIDDWKHKNSVSRDSELT